MLRCKRVLRVVAPIVSGVLEVSAGLWRLRRRARLLGVIGAALACSVGAAFADPPAAPQPPTHSAIDERGVDLTSGIFNLTGPSITIGQPGAGGLSYAPIYSTRIGGTWSNNFQTSVSGSATAYTVTMMGTSARFINTNGVITPAEGQGGSLTYSFVNNAGFYTYTARDGTVAQFFQPTGMGYTGVVTSITRPSGEVLTFTHQVQGSGATASYRLMSVTNNFGYQIKLEYAPSTWWLLVKATAINNAVDYCDPAANGCSSLSQTWPSLSFGNNADYPVTIADALGQTTTYTYAGRYITGVRWPSSATDNITIGYDGESLVGSISNGAETYNYNYSYTNGGATRVTTVTGPASYSRVMHSAVATNLVASDADALGRTTSFQYDPAMRLTRITQPEGNYTHYTYDLRSNVTEVRQVSKTGAPADIVTAIGYMEGSSVTSCANVRTCNQPATITDARGGVTNFTYNATHGGVLTVTAPAPTVGAVRPQTRFTYAQHNAWYRTSSSSTRVQGPAIWRLTQTSACTTAASCANQAQEVRSTTTYQTGSASVGSNILPVSNASGSGNGALTATVATTYDVIGNETAQDGPLTGTTDTSYFRYDPVRRLVGVVQPDPDASGALKRSAVRTTYDLDGRVSLVEVGTVAGTSEADWTAFVVTEQNGSVYDARGRLVRKNLVAGGTTHAVIQYSYDPVGRSECTAVRMNAAVFNSLPASACTQSTQGADGPDRIERRTYNAAGEVLSVLSAYGTGAQQVEQLNAYTVNGRLDWVQDANGNRSDYEYDGFDRTYRTYFPSASLGAQAANPADYEQFGYDANGNLTSARVRSGETISFSYDALNRLTSKGGAVPGVNYAYDLLGRQLSALFASGGQGVVYTYDALGRVLTEVSFGRTLTSQYNIAGDRTRLTLPDNNYVAYTYDVLGRMDQVRENNASSGAGLLADHTYDDLGRLTAVSRGNGTATNFGYDSTSRLNSLVQNFSGTAQDLTLTYGFNAGNQTLTRTPSNASFAYAPPSTGVTAYARDGLNRYTSVASVSFSYDGRSNLTSDGARTFAYDLENHLTSVSGSASMTLTYDPLGRLRQTVSGGVTRQFLYDGDALVAEYDGAGTMVRRYVHGAGVDEPLVWYEGAGLTNRAWLHADELGSVIATSNGSGVATIYAYDAYGRPANDNWSGSRFRYTGQIALPEVQLYHYKARVYDPTLGRFLQTDPIGYGDGLNMYAYVANDPANATDPFGLECTRPSDPNEVVVCGTRDQCDWLCMANLRTTLEFYQRHQGLIDGLAGFIPGATAAMCAARGCDATEWALAAADFIPAARAATLLARLARSCFCVTGDTLVATPDGLVPISEIEVGDLVLAVNLETGGVQAKPVTALGMPPPQPTLSLTVESSTGARETFRASAEHPWRTDGRGWVNTQDLRVGDRLVTASGEVLTLSSLNVTGEVEQTYTLEVADLHNYLVGENQIVVHNGACDILRRQFDRMRPGLWRREAAMNPGSYSNAQLQRMQRGQPPIGSDGHSMEWHHKTSLENGGDNSLDNLQPMTRTEHRLGENYRLNHPRP